MYVANIFPIYGLIFATMGLYCMVEDGQVDLVSDGDIKNYEKFIFGLSRLNHAFQQVKFWEFTQPCLYLARALPYVTTRRIVEGYMVSLYFLSCTWDLLFFHTSGSSSWHI